MRAEQVITILRREYLTRVKSKGFWIATLILPIAMGALVVLPSLILMRSKATHRLTVVDAVGGVGERVTAELERRTAPAAGAAMTESTADAEQQAANFVITVVAAGSDAEAQKAQLDASILAGEIDAWIWISPRAIADGVVEYHAESVSNFITQRRLEKALSRVFAELRLAEQGYDAAKVVELTKAVDLTTLKVTEKGATEEEGMAGFMLAYLLFFLLYLVMAIYGGLVMNGVLEEKSSRIIEVLLATTSSKELLYGKLLGIGAAGLTQLAVWALALGALTAPGVVSMMAFSSGAIPQVAPSVLVHFLFHFLLGFFLFSSMYAAIGSATNSVQEAQPLTGIVVPFLIAPMLFMVAVINDPDSTLAVVLSLIPTFTPLLMMLRIAVKSPPLWQIALGYVLTAAFVMGLMEVCARIYRVGILMYGKRPTIPELWRWIRRA